jgi:hypothetical protein
MGLDAQMLFRSPRLLRDDEIARLNHDLVRTFYYPLGCFGYQQQLEKVAIAKTARGDFGDRAPDVEEAGEDRRIPPQHRAGGAWYWVHLGGRYYGVGYEHGDIWGTIGIAEWLEFRIPGVEVWYGSDTHEFLEPFPGGVREELARHFFAVGHGAAANP